VEHFESAGGKTRSVDEARDNSGFGSEDATAIRSSYHHILIPRCLDCSCIRWSEPAEILRQ